MSEVRATRALQGGFTLLELLIAAGILTFAVTALLGALSIGVGTARSAEMRDRAALLADTALQEVVAGILPQHPIPEDWQKAEDLAIPPVTVDGVDGFPDMKYSVTFRVDPERPEVVLAEIDVSWREQGEFGGQVFRRILPRESPLPARVAALRTPR